MTSWNRLTVVTLAVCLALLGACGQEPQDDPPSETLEISQDPVVTPDEARQIAENWNAEIIETNATLDRARQDSLETSPARDIDDAFFVRFLAMGRTTAGGTPRNLDEITTFVPRQTAFPARFLAFVRLGSAEDPAAPDLLRLRLFEKAAADEPWKLALYVNLPQDFTLPELSLDGEGFAQSVSELDSPDLKLEPGRVSEELAAYLSERTEDNQSSIFAPGTHTTEASTRFREATENAAQNDLSPSLEIRVTPGDYTFMELATTDGGALVLFDQKQTTVNEAPSGSTMNTQNTPGLEGLLDPGSYARIQRNQINMVAALVPPASSEELVQVIGSNGGLVSVEAE